MQRIKVNVPVLRSRICRQSIGIVCMQEYNRDRAAHQQAELQRDGVDNVLYAKEQVVWLVEQVCCSRSLQPRSADIGPGPAD